MCVARTSGYQMRKSANRPICSGTCKNGKPCSRLAQEGAKRCRWHPTVAAKPKKSKSASRWRKPKCPEDAQDILADLVVGVLDEEVLPSAANSAGILIQNFLKAHEAGKLQRQIVELQTQLEESRARAG